ncbi:MAG: nicotinamide riboside transporter PnuC [Rhodothermales bacterium]
MDFLGEIDYVEAAAVVTGFFCVLLYVRQNIWSWPTGLVSAALFIIVFFHARLYADMGLQGVYVVLSAYGWYQWLYGGPEHGALKVSRLTRPVALVLGSIVVVGTTGMAWSLATYTDADLPFWDSLTTVMSLVAQWMIAKKILENWLVWITADVLYIGIFLYKGLYLTSGLYVLFLILATTGFFAWRTSMRAESATVPV